MNPTTADYQAMLARVAPKNLKTSLGEPVKREADLHDQIEAYCKSQWPRWKYRHARMDKATTEAKGVEDFTIFMPEGRTIHLECKAKGQKQSVEQLGWEKEMSMLGHKVYLIYSFADFLNVVDGSSS